MRPNGKSLLLAAKPLVAVLALVLAAALSGHATRAGDTGGSGALDRLFAQLKVAPDADAARKIESQIWAIWTEPKDPVLAGKMSDLLSAVQADDLKAAMSLANAIVKAWPHYAEGWNQRATIEYMRGQVAASLADIAETLKLEPRHFGAISGRILIELQRGERSGALKDLRTVLKLDPYAKERTLFPGLLPPPTRT